MVRVNLSKEVDVDRKMRDTKASHAKKQQFKSRKLNFLSTSAEPQGVSMPHCIDATKCCKKNP